MGLGKSLQKFKIAVQVGRKMAYEGLANRYWPLAWQDGNRTKEGKYKLTGIFDFQLLDRIHFQGLLAHYPEGACQPPHVDELKKYHIYRMVVVLKKGEGGELVGGRVHKFGRLYFMRPDLYQHEVTPVTKGERISLLLSFYKRKMHDICIEEVPSDTP